MTAVLLRAASLAFVMALGILLKKTGIVEQNAGEVIKKLLINLTLPAAIIVNFAAIPSIQSSFLFLAFLGMALDIVGMVVGAWMTKKETPEKKALYMLELPAYNIGTFCIPFVQSFLPGIGSVSACIFDVGNSVICTGGSYAFCLRIYIEKQEWDGLQTVCKAAFDKPTVDDLRGDVCNVIV